MTEKTPSQSKGHIPWHSGFRDAIQTTLEPYRDILELKFEHQLTAEALRLDALIIKKKQDTPVKHDIAAFFKAWNILEYKSPDDTFSVPEFHKVIGYSHIYMATEPDTVWEEGTITIIRTGESRSVLKHLRDQGYKITKRMNETEEVWAYEVEGYGIPIQIIQSEHLSEAGNMLLRHLRKDLDTSTLQKVLGERELQRNIRLLGAYLQVLLEANKEQFKEVTAMINSPVIEQILEENGWAEKFRQQERRRWERDRQVWEEKWQKTEVEYQKAETERQKTEAEYQKAETERQKAETERQKTEAEYQKAEMEIAELKERLRLSQQMQAESAPGTPEQRTV